MAKIFTIINQKGGVGKTTTCVNLSAALGVLEHRTLLIDTDPQAHALLSFGIQPKDLKSPGLKYTRYESHIINSIISTPSQNVDIIHLHDDFLSFDPSELSETDKKSKFSQTLKRLKKIYNYIIIDCTPFINTNTFNILFASEAIIIPIQCEYYSLEGLAKFLKTVRFIQKTHNESLEIAGFLLTMHNERLKSSQHIVSEIQSYFGDLVFQTIIHRNTHLGEAPGYGKSIFDHNISSKGAADYLSLAVELVEKNNNTTKTNESHLQQHYIPNSHN
ncbi:MAG: ParA family protein, partial [Bacteroidota bacterium]